MASLKELLARKDEINAEAKSLSSSPRGITPEEEAKFDELRAEVDTVIECVEMGEHFKRIVSSGGYDVCFNCGGNY